MRREIALALALAFGAATAAVAQEGPGKTDQDLKAQQQELRAAATAESPAAKVEALKKFIAAHPDGPLTNVARRILLDALVQAKAPAAELVAAGETIAEATPAEEGRFDVYNTVAMALADRGEMLDKANEFATKALASAPVGEKETQANLKDTLGWVQVKRGEYDQAIANISAAAAVGGDNQDVLYHLGVAYEKAGKNEQAIDAYVKSASVFLGRSTAADEPLRALYQKQHGSLAGLDERLATAREASRRYAIFESRKWEKPAPGWELKNLAGKPVKLDDYKGKLIVMDFWGSWCPPCRAELPKFQALQEKYKSNKNVVFLGMNWEQPGAPEERMKKVTDFMAKNGYTFPVVIDHDRVAVKAYEIEGFPTVYLIDPQGMIRYRNLGFEDGVEQIIEAQLESMMK